MRKQLSIPAVIVPIQPSLCAVQAHAEQPAGDKIRVVIIDGRNNHDWRATTPHIKRVLEQVGRFTVDVATNPQADGKQFEGDGHVKFPPDVTKYDVVLSNYNDGKLWPVELSAALEENLKSGKVGLSIVHAANNAFENWKEYNRMIGLGWRSNRFGDRLIVDNEGREVRVAAGQGPGSSHGARHPFLITVRDTDHPITRGMPREWMHATDELYHGLRGPIENVHLLATAYSSKKYNGTNEHEPMIWTVTY